jgi:hypothetical protein
LSDELAPLTEDELADLQREYQAEHPDSHVLRLIHEIRRLREVGSNTGRGVTALSMEIQRVRSLLRRVYPLLGDGPEMEELRAEIEREMGW